MTKADKIRELYALGWATSKIAAEVGCRVEYVRVCAQQRRDGRMSRADRKYLPTANEVRKNRYATDPSARHRRLATNARSRARKAASQEART